MNIRTSWWRDCADKFGCSVIDKELQHISDPDAIIASGRREIKRAIDVTAMRTGTALTAIEIGCGVGRLTTALSEHFGAVLGLDISPAFIAQAREQNRKRNVQYDLINGASLTPTSVKQCDVVFSFEVFHYLPEDVVRRYLHGAFKLLRSNGQIIIQLNTVPYTVTSRAAMLIRGVMHALGKEWWRGWPTAPGFSRIVHSTRRLEEILSDAGFSTINVINAHTAMTWITAERQTGEDSDG